MKNFYTSVVELRRQFDGAIATHPYEAGWADEAIFFVTVESDTSEHARVHLEAQLSADGIRWLAEGSSIRLDGPGSAFLRLRDFGGFLRLAGDVTDDTDHPGCSLTVRLALKG